MYWANLHDAVIFVQRAISFAGVLIILLGILFALIQFVYYLATGEMKKQPAKINAIRLNLGRILILGLEFIIAADLIGTTTTPDYYAVGILGIIVLIRIALSWSLNREIMTLNKEK